MIPREVECTQLKLLLQAFTKFIASVCCCGMFIYEEIEVLNFLGNNPSQSYQIFKASLYCNFICVIKVTLFVLLGQLYALMDF